MHNHPAPNFPPRYFNPPTMSASDPLSERKGRQVRLIGGTFKAHKHYVGAWLDSGKRQDLPSYYHIIVEKPDPEDPDTTYLDTFKALKSNCVAPYSTPTTYVQAAFQQIPQLDARLVDFAKIVAKCRIQRSRELSNIIKAAIDKEARILLQRGYNATYHIIDTSMLPNPVTDNEDDSNSL